MTQDEIEHMWKVASNNPNHDTNWHDPVVVAFAKLVAAKERERYMPLLTELAHIVRTKHLYGPEMKKLLEQEEAIRARGEA